MKGNTMWGTVLLARLLTTAALYGGVEYADRKSKPIHKQKPFVSSVKLEDRVGLTDEARYKNTKK